MIRRGFFSLVLIGLTLGLLAVVGWRIVDLKTSLLPDVELASSDDPTTIRKSPAAPILRQSAPLAEVPTETRVLDRSLVVVGLGWDRLAPALLANVGAAPSSRSAFARSGLSVSIAPVEGIADVIEALASGGGQNGGADVAIVPLPQWLAAQDRVRAIDPVVFYVAGWSRGREAVLETPTADAAETDTGGRVRIGFEDVGPAYLALFALDAEGIPPRNVLLVSPDAEPPPSWQAVDVLDFESALPSPVRTSTRWTTSQASGLIPVVMVASRPWVDDHPEALVAWLRGWVHGIGELSGNIAAAARRLGRLDDAPRPLRLMHGLETWKPASLRENLALFELDGPEPPPLRPLMRRTWRVLSAARLAAAEPQVLPISATVVRAAARADLPLEIGDSRSPRESMAGDPTSGKRVVLTRPLDDVDGYELALELAALSSAFPTAVLRVTPRMPNGPVPAAFELAQALSSGRHPVVLADPNPELSTAATLEVLLAP